MKGLFEMFIAIFFVVLVANGCVFVTDYFKDDSDSQQVEEKAYAVSDGQIGYLTNDLFVAIDEQSYDELISYSVANNSNAIENMLLQNRIFVGNKGDKVTVVDFGYSKSLIEVRSTGIRGYVSTEKVKDKLVEDES